MKQDQSPDIHFMGIGAPKCGTSKIAQLLAAHPDICLSEPKDIQYFNKKTSYILPPINPNQQKDISWYYKHFNHCTTDSIKGEFATTYLYCEHAPLAIKKLFPDIKLIVAIRQPAERAYSHYLMLNQFQQKEKRPFNVVIKEEKEYVEKGLYAQQLKRFFNHFDASQILVIPNQLLKTKPEQITQSLYDFLGVNTEFSPTNIGENFNQAKSIKNIHIAKLYGKVFEKMIDLGMSNVINQLRKTGIKKLYDKWMYKKIEVPKMDKDSFNFIMENSIDDIESLERILNIDLNHWKFSYNDYYVMMKEKIKPK